MLEFFKMGRKVVGKFSVCKCPLGTNFYFQNGYKNSCETNFYSKKSSTKFLWEGNCLSEMDTNVW